MEENRNNYGGPVPPTPMPKFETAHIPERRPKKLWKLGGLLTLAGLILFAAGWFNGARNGSMYFDADGFHLRTGEDGELNKVIVNQNLEEFDEITVKTRYENIYLIASDRYGLEISHQDENELKWAVHNGQLSLDTTGMDFGDIKISFFNLDFSESYIKIYYPEDDYFNNVNLNSGSGGITAELPFTENAELKAGSGDINARFSGMADIKAETGSGTVTLTNDSYGVKANIKTGSGFVNVTDGRWDELKVETGSGSVDIDAELNGETKVNTGSGSVEIISHGTERQGYDLSSSSGSIYVNGDRIRGENADRNEDSKNVIEVNTGSGSIELEIEE